MHLHCKYNAYTSLVQAGGAQWVALLVAALTSRRGAAAELLAPLLRGLGSLVELLGPHAALAALPPLLLRHAAAPDAGPTAAAAAAIHAAAACLPIFCKADLVTLLRSAAAALAHRGGGGGGGGGGGSGGVPAGACQLAASLLTLELKEQPEVVERGQSDCWAVPQLGSCASSGGAWRLWAARHSQSEAQPLEAQPLPGISNDPRSKSPI